jgi:uncharacterized membrane protein
MIKTIVIAAAAVALAAAVAYCGTAYWIVSSLL